MKLKSKDLALVTSSVFSSFVSICSTIAVYIKVNSNFKDKQDTEIKISNETSASASKTQIHISFNNLEQFTSQSESLKNKTNNSTVSTNNQTKKCFSEIDPKTKEYGSDAVIKNEDFQNALDTNNKGDEITGNVRTTSISTALRVFESIIMDNNKHLKFFYDKTLSSENNDINNKFMDIEISGDDEDQSAQGKNEQID